MRAPWMHSSGMTSTPRASSTAAASFHACSITSSSRRPSTRRRQPTRTTPDRYLVSTANTPGGPITTWSMLPRWPRMARSWKNTNPRRPRGARHSAVIRSPAAPRAHAQLRRSGRRRARRQTTTASAHATAAAATGDHSTRAATSAAHPTPAATRSDEPRPRRERCSAAALQSACCCADRPAPVGFGLAMDRTNLPPAGHARWDARGMNGRGPDRLAAEVADIVGAPHVLTDPELMARYVVDWTGRWRGVARFVARPASTAEVAAVIAACGRHGVPLVPQGGNTGLVGGGVPGPAAGAAGPAVLLSLARLDGIEPIDT